MVSRLMCVSLLVIAVLFTLQSCLCKVHNYEDFDIETIFSDTPNARRFMNCVKNESSCTQDDKVLKADLTDIIMTSCAKCTEAEKANFKKATEVIRKKTQENPKLLKLFSSDKGN